MLPLLTKNNKLIVKDTLVATDLNNDPRARIGFQAFTGANRYFKRLKFWDIDCCYLFPQIYFPDDGTFTIEKVVDDDCCCPICKVVECERWFCCATPVNTIIPCPISFNQAYTQHPDSCLIPPPAPRKWFSWTINPQQHIVTPTTWSLGVSPGCCNPLGNKLYFELLDEIL